MTRILESKRREAASGVANSVVVFLHGYGADGADLLGLADPLSEHMPDTTFIAPDAPEKCLGNPMGYQWFPIPWLDGSSEEDSMRGVEMATADINAFLDQVLEDEGIEPSQLIVFGFSQGSMMSMRVLPRRDEPIAGLVAFSGRMLEPDQFAENVVSKLPILLVHGDQDDMVPPGHFSESGEVLQAAGFETYGFIMKETGHGIAMDGLSVALSFMMDKLGLASDKPSD
ncbi:phospholipase/carboxylesterase [Aliiroseovarius halocynthiae]|uniref:Alpha/beta fold hydrolase n=1 Tax=Aliiroseovarius halocynthiae TaxID=985055 RepID=A0A545SVM8_9RHOB|nr:alpha/beta fold hydrolase [Aliiroseovarius halocynthiae]TQV69014.1 alpha/beta fold hydrolase [Aliiroseovarius halocynthiae]SMR71764.1 phospholipase/carboxylesterase [Aliiroseovarius halocynthiae]